MTNKEYQEKAQRTSGTENKDQKLLNAALGLTGEAGEFSDHLKKHLMQGHDLDENHLIKEIGDILWYCVEAAEGLETTLDEIMVRNIAKLEDRYPEGYFMAKRSRERVHTGKPGTSGPAQSIEFTQNPRECSNCKYRSLQRGEFPCCDCFRFNKWETTE